MLGCPDAQNQEITTALAVRLHVSVYCFNCGTVAFLSWVSLVGLVPVNEDYEREKRDRSKHGIKLICSVRQDEAC